MATVWRQKLIRRNLTDHDQHLLEAQLDLKLYGMRKDEESIAGFQILHEDDGLIDALLMRRDFDAGGFWFDLDVTLGQVTEEEKSALFLQVAQTITALESRAEGESAFVHREVTMPDGSKRQITGLMKDGEIIAEQG